MSGKLERKLGGGEGGVRREDGENRRQRRDRIGVRTGKTAEEIKGQGAAKLLCSEKPWNQWAHALEPRAQV